MSIEHGTDLTDEFHRLADQPAPPYLVDLGQIVTTGRREKRRRRATRAALTTTTAAVALCGVATVAHFSAQPGRAPSAVRPASTSGTAITPTYRFPTTVSDSSATATENVLHGLGYTHLIIKSVNSDTVAAGNVTDILDARNQSVLGTSVAVGTPLTLLVSIGPGN